MNAVEIGWREKRHSTIIRAGVIGLYAEQGEAAFLTPASSLGTSLGLSDKTLASYVRSNKSLGYQDESNEPTKEGIAFAVGILSRNIASQCGHLEPSERAIYERAPRLLNILQNYGPPVPGQ
jgi:hypothetical protein